MDAYYIFHLETMRKFLHRGLEFKSGEVWATEKKLRLSRGWVLFKATGVDVVTLNEKR